ncbi:HesB/YadR/YfhF family protein [Limosilactobacillus panis]|uniref:Heme biosynthesis protein HemY n=1 Tax=Limosilactobacillus panis TaxID=47493 RepID=A0ABT7VK62_9LACO|nr:heme biosynthesis protein HemY [Limosilactobacillus panis]MDM8333113.1 heme biosynthesis protein HemY [Limosilactobacillus panis]HJA22527.1 heme biosynthesis protein HemY [Candidatus Limosilactobacillus intestinipullorum]
MKLIVTDRAHQWFKDELGLTAGTGIKFYGKTYGYTEVHHGFSPAFTREDQPIEPVLAVEKDGVNYHVDELDEWFFKDLVTTVDYNPKTDGPIFHFRHEDADDGPDVAGISKEQEEHPDASTGASQH